MSNSTQTNGSDLPTHLDVEAVNALHERAMLIAEEGVALRQLAAETATEERKAVADQANDAFFRAYEAELASAMLLVTHFDLEPTRGVLFRSAAALALDAGLHAEAARAAAFGLAGKPPAAVAEELREAYDIATFEQHLALAGIELLPNEARLSLYHGESVGHGIVESTALVDRVRDLQRLAERHVARKRGIAFQERGPVGSASRSPVRAFLKAPKASSFSFSIQFGIDRQVDLFEGEIAAGVVSELVELFDLYNNGQLDELRERIPSEAYFRNFVELARRIAPDGKHVKGVAIAAADSRSEDGIRSIRMEPRSFLPLAPSRATPGKEVPEEIVLRGELRGAESIKGNKIKLLSPEGETTMILVPEGMMADIVRPLWEDRVVVVAERVGKRTTLMHIYRDEVEEGKPSPE